MYVSMTAHCKTPCHHNTSVTMDTELYIYDLGRLGSGRVAHPASLSATHKAAPRTLATYPMDHSYDDTLHVVSECRRRTEGTRLDARRASAASDNLTRRSRILFEDAVDSMSRASSAKESCLPRLSSADTCTPSYAQRIVTSPRRPVTSSSYMGVTSSSAPTLRGSSINSFHTNLLKEIRVHKTPELTPRDNLTGIPDIKAILHRSNSIFRVIHAYKDQSDTVDNAWEYINSSSYPGYRLVPTNGDEEFNYPGDVGRRSLSDNPRPVAEDDRSADEVDSSTDSEDGMANRTEHVDDGILPDVLVSDDVTPNTTPGSDPDVVDMTSPGREMDASRVSMSSER